MKRLSLFIASLLVFPTFIFAQVNWQNVSTLGMGYVDGLTINPITNTKYVRTDVGGIFRYNDATQRWSNLTDTIVTGERSEIACIEAFALDKKTSGANTVLYALSGNGGKVSYLLKSVNDGKSWTINQGWTDSIYVFGNGDWRCSGEKIAVDPNNSNVVYCGTRRHGLWKTTNAATQWNKVTAFTEKGGNGGLAVNGGVSFVVFDPTLAVTINGQTVSKNIYVGLIDGGIFRSTDGGVSWCGINANGFDVVKMNPIRAVFNNNRLIVALMADGEDELDGDLWQFTPNTNNCSGTWANKTPGLQNNYSCPVWGKYRYNAVAVRPEFPNTVYVATRGTMPRKIFYTENFDAAFPTWKIMTMDDNSGYMGCADKYKPTVFKAPSSWVNIEGYDWVGDIGFDAVDNKRLWMTSGNGVLSVDDISASTAQISSLNSMKDLEILCVNQIAAPPLPNKTPLFTAVMDILGVNYQDNTGNFKKIDPTFGLGAGISLTYSFKNPNNMALVGEDYGNPSNINRNIRTTDGGTTWKTFWDKKPTCTDAPWGGNIALSATNGENMVWVPSSITYGNGCATPTKNAPRFTKDGGATWTTCSDINFAEGNFPFLLNSAFSIGKSLESDKVNGDKFYYFAMQGYTFQTQLWRTTNGGANWTKMSEGKMPITGNAQLKANPYKEDDIWFAPFNSYIRGNDPNPDARKLWHSTDGGANWSKLTTMDEIYAFGFGMKAVGSNNASLIVYGKKGTKESIFVSYDLGVTFADLGVRSIPAGIISNIEGDMKTSGRVYISTGCRGVFFGDISAQRTSIPRVTPKRFGRFTIVPNPAKDFFNVELPFKIQSGTAKLTITNMLGRVVQTITLSSGNETINITGYQKGTYIVNCVYEEGIYAAKLTVQ
jgi:xyloglucan-specific exo-beta-1,4-glucanase